MQIALSKSGDIIKGENGGILRVDKGRYVIQSLQSKLKTRLGEWLLDPSLGFINLDDYVKNPNLYNIEIRAQQIILETEGVLSLDSISLELTKRVLYLSFTATTIYGSIDLTVPWEL